MIDYRDSCWFVVTSHVDFGFWSYAAALSFAINNLKITPKMTNKAILAKVKEH